jgi:small-conductance mechanosensitive channel
MEGEPSAVSPTPEVAGSEVREAEQGQASSVQQRLDRLEAENDSLRAAVGTLLNAIAAGGAGRVQASPDSTPPDSSRVTSVTGQVRLTVDARRVGHWGIRIVVATLFILFAQLFIRILVWVLERLAERNAKRRLFFKRLVPIARISLWFLTILFVALVILNIQAQGLLAAGAAVGVAVGFAAQDIIKNIFGGIIVLFDQPFQVGDKISVGGTYGEVVSIGLRSTRITTPDDNLVSVPNSQVVAGQVANANAGELNCQVVTDLYLPGWVDEAVAKRIAFEAATSSKYVYLNKPIVVLVKDEFKETFLTHLKVKAYVLDPRYEFLLMSDVTERARAGFRKAGLIGPMHGVRAYVDMDRFSPETGTGAAGCEEEG